MSESPFIAENGWAFRPLTLKRSDLVKLAGVFVEIHGSTARVATVRDLRAATLGFTPIEDDGIQSLSESGDPKQHWYLRDLLNAIDEAAGA